MLLPHPLDKFDPETLPDPELNPLLNPLLGAHMGRWAEVYFTSPPEKRSQAVADLLRELKNAPAAESDPGQNVIDERREKQIQALQSSLPISEQRRAVFTCQACTHENALGQKFCGMCGAPLQFPEPADLPQFKATALVSDKPWRDPEPVGAVQPMEYASAPTYVSTVADGNHDYPDPVWPVSEADLPHFAQEPESVPYRYRLYVGVVLAILLAALMYIAWRGKAALFSGDTQSAPSRPVPAAPPPAPAAPAQPPKSTANVLPTESSAAPTAPVPAPAPAQSETKSQPVSREDQRPNARRPNARPAARLVQAASSSAPIAADQGGAEELATAEKYLSSTPRTSGNSGEAAQWLWKAVAKGNLMATMTLSDMYLRGDGVPKNCDQARLLLDAAARKGKPAAAARLRNLQAFGCE